jgi:hypothetical protein
MTRGDSFQEYRRLNGQDQSAFRRWLIANTIFGVVAVFALIAVASTYSGGDSDAMTAQKQQMLIQAEAQ